MNLLPSIQSTADALHAEKTRIEVVAQNIANAQTTKGADGKPYQRQTVAFQSYIDQLNGKDLQRLKVGDVNADTRPGEVIYAPAHPHANADGMLELPNVQVPLEMVDMITATRAYESNLNVLKSAREMAQQTIAIGR